jgi:hypothetical protein
MIEIEFEEPMVKKCDCCGQEIVTLTRFVYNDGEAFTVYYANFTRGHEDKVVTGIIGIGEWGDNAEPIDRLAFPFRIWTNETNYQVGLIDAKESLWSDVTFLGQILNRDEALNHEWVSDVFHITDHIVKDDKLIVEYFNN